MEILKVIFFPIFISWKIFDHLLAFFITHFRPVFALFVVLPLSVVFDFFLYSLPNWMPMIEKYFYKQTTFQERVQNVQKQIKDWNDEGRKTKLCTGRPGWQAMSLRIGKYFTKINLSSLKNINKIDIQKNSVFLEPNCNMGQVTSYLSPLGYTLPVIPELDALTVGGLINGMGIESSSHQHGLFQHNCISFDIVTVDGELIHCDKSTNSEIFRSIPWSHGTIGFLVQAEIKIIPAKPYIELTYTPFFNKQEWILFFQEAIKNPQNNFVEGLQYTEANCVVMVGKFAQNLKNYPINPIGKYYKPWFYKHVEGILKKEKQCTELIPLRDYYHRHSKSIFWEAADIVPFGNWAIFRYVLIKKNYISNLYLISTYTLGWMMPPNISLLKRTQTEQIRKLYEQHHVVQDMLIPITQFSQALSVYKNNFDLRDPLWICPFRLFPEDQGFLKLNDQKQEFYVDIGAYGVPLANDYNYITSLQKVEEFVLQSQGFQLLYADTFLTREQFKQMFDHTLQVRKQVKCENYLPEVYDKVSKAARI